MLKKLVVFLLTFLVITFPHNPASAQQKKDNTIRVKGVDFLQVCNVLLDAGYVIEKKDNDLQTVKTEFRPGKDKNRYMNLCLIIRVKDSVAIITGQWYNTLFDGARIAGQEQTLSNSTYKIENTSGNPKACFKEMNEFASRLGKDLLYSKD